MSAVPPDIHEARYRVRGPSFFEKKWVPPFFFVATVLSVFYVGTEHATGYFSMLDQEPSVGDLLWQASIYTLALVAILATHEMGHWIVSRVHGVRTTLPIFIPMPFGMGTFGAVISQNELAPTRTVLLRIGAAGPIAGGIVALALMAVAVATCPVIKLPSAELPEGGGYILLGDSIGTLLFSALNPQEIPPGHDVAATPLFMAAWVGFLLTSLNLFPVGQLDGGHIAYALYGERMNRLFPLIALGVIGLSVLAVPLTGGIAPQYIFWGLLIRTFVSWHPPVPQPEPALGRGSVALVAASVLLFALTFMPAPMSFVW